MQFGRYPEEETQSKKPLPEEWTEALTKTLTETYFEQSEKDNCFFDVYGEIYNKDFVVVVSYLHHDDPMLSYQFQFSYPMILLMRVKSSKRF